ncbi:MAG: hypothetical protein ACUVT7_00990 [Thermoplasmata archaeon]
MTMGPAPSQPAPAEQPRTRSCVSCGRSIDWNANVCPYCGHDFRVPVQAVQPRQKSMVPVVGGILIVIAGVLALAMGIMYFVLDVSDIQDYGVTLPPEMTAEDLQDVLHVCGGVLIVFAVMAFVGGVFAIQRKHFALAIVGGIFGLLGIGFLIGSLLGLIGLILVAVGRKDFD